VRRYLVVAHQTLGTVELLEAMRDRLAEGPCTFHLVVPELQAGATRLGFASWSLRMTTTASRSITRGCS
jgi:hypothetical protein